MPQENSVLVQLRALMAQNEEELKARLPHEALEVAPFPIEEEDDFDEFCRLERERMVARGVDPSSYAESYARGDFEVRRDFCRTWDDYDD